MSCQMRTATSLVTLSVSAVTGSSTVMSPYWYLRGRRSTPSSCGHTDGYVPDPMATAVTVADINRGRVITPLQNPQGDARSGVTGLLGGLSRLRCNRRTGRTAVATLVASRAAMPRRRHTFDTERLRSTRVRDVHRPPDSPRELYPTEARHLSAAVPLRQATSLTASGYDPLLSVLEVALAAAPPRGRASSGRSPRTPHRCSPR